MTAPRSDHGGVDAAVSAIALGVLCVLSALVLIKTGSIASPHDLNLTAVLFLGLAFSLTKGVSARLPQGDEVCVDQMVGLAGLWLVSPATLLAAVILGGLADGLSRRIQEGWREAGIRLIDLVRRAAVLGILSPLPMLTSLQQGDAVFVPVAALGLLYTALDVVTLGMQQRLTSTGEGPTGLLSILRPLASIYLVHISMAAVVVRVYPALGFWAFFIALLLTLILQNGLNLYLRIRRAYTETIRALAQAAELDRPEDAGHARRVANLAIAVGRRLGISGQALERLGYAALLHDVGQIGHSGDGDHRGHAARGAQIVESIPFLAAIGPLIANHHCETTDEGPGLPLGAVVVGVCSDFDRLRARHGSTLALQRLTASAQGVRANVVVELTRVIASRRDEE